MISIQFCGGAGSVTGANYVIDNGKIIGAGPTAAFLGAKIKPGEPQKADISALDK